MEKQKPRSRKKKPLGFKFYGTIGLTAVAAVAAAGAAVYIQMGRPYKTVFFPNTTINGIDASKKTVEEVKSLIASGISGYELTIEEKDSSSETIKGSEIGLESAFDGSLEKLLEEQKPGDWWKHRSEAQEFEIGTMIQYDETKLQEQVDGLDCFDEASVTKPQNAYISHYVSGQGFSIVPAVEGTKLQKEAVLEGIKDAVTNMKSEISLEELGAYEKPEVAEDDETLAKRLEAYNKYAGVTVTYDFGTKKEVLNGDTISGWLGTDDAGEVYVSSSKVVEYVKELASKYDTYNKAKTLKTSYGQTVKISKGSYGWRINQDTEAGELAAVIQSGESQTREPVYKQKAASHGDTDYGSTYVEINLTAQHLFFYKDGKLLVESDFVSGNQSKGWATPDGVYPLTYKERNATLKGEDYRTPVDYWMPFNGGIGLHDAGWRSSFGGTLYKNGGSHGCVNLPPAVAAKIFENISAGTPVLCYFLEGTESKKTTNASGKAIETTAPTTAAPTEAPTTAAKPAEVPTTAPVPETSPVPETPAASTEGNKEVGPGVSSSGISGSKAFGPGMNE